MALNHYSHYRNSKAARDMFEVVSPALFEVYLKFPDILGDNKNTEGGVNYMFEHVRSVSGLDGATPTVGNVVQKYKFAERHYAAAGPDKTSLELTLTYTLNLNSSHENYIYNMLRRWYDLVYNPQNGKTRLKRDYAGGSILDIYEHDRDGEIWRHIRCFNFFPSTPPTGLNDDNYDSVAEAKTVSITFMVDDWVEQAVGMDQYRDMSSGAIIPEGYDKYPPQEAISGGRGNVYGKDDLYNSTTSAGTPKTTTV